MTSTSLLTSLGAPFFTAIIAVVAIVVNYRSSRRSVEKDIELKKWEKRTDAYSDLVGLIDEQDPRNAPSLHSITSIAIHEEAAIAALSVSEDTWRSVDAKVRIYASQNVAVLFSLWKYFFADWTMARTSSIINEGHWEQSTTTEQEAFDREIQVRALLARIRREIILHVRSELDFRYRPLPQIVRSASGGLSVTLRDDLALPDLEALVNQDFDTVTSVRRERGGWSAIMNLQTGLSVEDMAAAERLWPNGIEKSHD